MTPWGIWNHDSTGLQQSELLPMLLGPASVLDSQSQLFHKPCHSLRHALAAQTQEEVKHHGRGH